MSESAAHGRRVCGSLDLPHGMIANAAVLRALAYFAAQHECAAAVEHPETTVTCAEKAALFDKYAAQYAPYGELRIARGTVLSWESAGEQHHWLFINDSTDRIDWRDVKWQVNLKKKDNLGPYAGDVEQIVGLVRGGVSPFVSANHRLKAILFDRQLLVRETAHPNALWDFAFSVRHSVFVRPTALLHALRENADIGKLAHWTKLRPT